MVFHAFRSPSSVENVAANLVFLLFVDHYLPKLVSAGLLVKPRDEVFPHLVVAIVFSCQYICFHNKKLRTKRCRLILLRQRRQRHPVCWAESIPPQWSLPHLTIGIVAISLLILALRSLLELILYSKGISYTITSRHLLNVAHNGNENLSLFATLPHK